MREITKVKFSVSINNRVFEKIESVSNELGLNRSAFISLACSDYIAKLESAKYLPALASLMKQISDNKEIDEDTLQQLKDFEAVSRLLGADV